MASLMEEFMEILEKENEEYGHLTELSTQKRQIIINGNVPALEDVTNLEQEVTGNLLNLENKRAQIVKDMAIVLNKDPKELTVTNMIAFLNKQPEEQQKLIEIKERLRGSLEKMEDINKQNELLLSQAIEMVEFDLTLFQSMRQAPTTANYDRRAVNTGEVLGNQAFDTKQ